MVRMQYLKMATLAKNGVRIQCYWLSYLEPTLILVREIAMPTSKIAVIFLVHCDLYIDRRKVELLAQNDRK